MAGPPPMKPARIQPVPPAMNSPERLAAPPEPAPGPKPLPRWRKGFRAATAWLFLVFLGGVVMQIGLAGAGLLGDDAYWTTGESEFLAAHVTFVRILELFPVLLIVCGFLGADKQAGLSGIALVFLIGVQYALIQQDGVVRSFHVLTALIIFTIALLMTLSRIPWRPHFLDAPPAPKA